MHLSRALSGRKLWIRVNWFPTIVIGLAWLVISFLHYSTAPGLSRLHTVYRYFYFLPIVYAALRFGYWGGLITASATTLAFAPHVFFKWGNFPQDSLNDLLVVVVFFGVAVITGITIDRVHAAESRQASALHRLAASLHQLEVQGEELRRAERLSALGLLAGGLAHEIRNPVGIIRASAQLMSLDQQPDMTETTRVIQEETDRIEALIQDLLDYAGDVPLQCVQTEVVALLVEVQERLKPLTVSSNVSVAVAVAPDLPPVCVDAEQIQRALVNICVNGIQAMERDGRLSLCAKFASTDVDFIQIYIADNGPGIPADLQHHIFDPFFTTRDEGAGLGLSVVERIVEDHHGRIWVESQPNSGATFILQLPVARNIEA